MQEEQYIYINKDGNKRYYADREMTILHRADGPAVECARAKAWWMNGQPHRTDGPALEWADGGKVWYANGQLHRTDGPALEWADGGKVWYANGKLHRTDGPAVERADGTKVWWMHGRRYTAEEFESITNPQPVELTLDQIAEKFGVDVKSLKIIK